MRIPSITLPETLVRRASRPWNLTVSLVCSMPSSAQHRRVEIVDIDRILDGGIAEFIGRAVDDARS